MIATLTDVRARRVLDELENDVRAAFTGTLPDAGAQVLCEVYRSDPLRRMAQPYHVKDQTFRITPAWFEFREVTYLGVPLKDMEPTEFEIGTRLYFECALRWTSASGQQDGAAVTFKNGAYTITRAEVKSYGPDESDPASSEGPPDSSINPAVLARDWTRRFLIGTIVDKDVALSQRGYAYLSAFPNAYDVALIPNF